MAFVNQAKEGLTLPNNETVADTVGTLSGKQLQELKNTSVESRGGSSSIARDIAAKGLTSVKQAALSKANRVAAEEDLPFFEEKAITAFSEGVRAKPASFLGSNEMAGPKGNRADSLSSGNNPADIDFSFAWDNADPSEGPWRHLRVACFQGTEAIGELYRYELTLMARDEAPLVDPEELIGARATLRIVTQTEPYCRVVHGIVVEAEELGGIASGGLVYRAVLAPPLARMAHRTRCRIFLEKTTRQIIDAVLLGDPELKREDGATAAPCNESAEEYTSAREVFTWRLANASRVDDVTIRPYCVQYNESDLAFISRILEEEGISYHFENGEGICLLVLSDSDTGRTRLEPFLNLGPGIAGRAIETMKLGARLRPRKVSMLDYNWKQPMLDMAVAHPAKPSPADLFDHQYPGRYSETPAMGQPLAMAKLDRLAIEASYAAGEGSCRVLAAGTIFALDHAQNRHDGEYLVTKLFARGEQAGVLPPGGLGGMRLEGAPYRISMECARRGKSGAPAESRFRPSRTTPKPRITGTQTGFVTAEPKTKGAEIHVGGPKGAEIGCVRVKFHWDQEVERHQKEPTSCWVRVNQVFAGVGEGAVFHPRVGVEVIVEFEDGDPDRPIVVGRVYNGQNRPPGGAPTVSTFKTMSSPGTGAFNELTFDDTAGNEQIKMHTPFNWNSDAGNDRSEKVGMNSASSAGVDRNENTGSNRSTMTGSNNSELIGGNESVMVGANQSVNIGANQSLEVGANQSTKVGANQTLDVTGNQTETITANRSITITGTDKLDVTGTQDIIVTGAQTSTFNSSQDIKVASYQKSKIEGEHTIEATGAQGIKSSTGQKIEAPEQEMKADGKQTLKSTNFLADASAEAKIKSAAIQVEGGTVEVKGSSVTIKGGTITIHEGNINIEGGQVNIKGSPITMDGGSLINASAALIKLN